MCNDTDPRLSAVSSFTWDELLAHAKMVAINVTVMSARSGGSAPSEHEVSPQGSTKLGGRANDEDESCL